MGTMLDIVTAMFVGGFLLLISITATDTLNQEFLNHHSDAIVQQNLTSITNTLEFDLRKMGFGIPEAMKDEIIQTASLNNLKFLAQLNLNASTYVKIPGVSTYDDTPDTIEYTISPYETVSFKDTSVTLYSVQRRIAITGITTSTMDIGRIANNDVFRYLDQLGDTTSVLQAIKMVEVTLTALNPKVVLSPELVMQRVGTIQDIEFRKRELRRILRASYWRQARLVSKNLKR
ncbi:MAG: hypothetical protein D6732_03260 [Methanobacteriota archaeon]|nr:MAG: hypothetical protein D6732_03260 [Euryarchaeota archaeon]